MSGFDVNEHFNLMKPDYLSLINQAIAAANINGITITTNETTTVMAVLPSNVAYIDVSQSFTQRQNIQATITDAAGNSIAGLGVTAWVDPTADDVGGIKIGTWSIGATTSGGLNDTTAVWGAANYAIHYGAGTIGQLDGMVANVDNAGAGIATLAFGVSSQVKNTGAGTITGAAAVFAQAPVNSGGGTFTAANGVEISNQGLAGMTTAKGLQIAAQSGATDNYAIYSEGGQVRLDNTSTATSGTAADAGIYEVYTVTPSGASSAEFDSVIAFCISAGAQNITGAVRGVNGIARHDGSGTVTLLNGLRGIANNNGTGTVTTAYGVRGLITVGASATTTNAYSLIAPAPTVTGTLTSIAQIAIEAPGAGTNRTNLLIGTATIPSGTYSIYNASAEANYFAGRFILEEITIPAAPAANQLAVYAKDNGAGVTKLYTLDSASTETELGGGGGSGLTHPQVMARTGF